MLSVLLALLAALSNAASSVLQRRANRDEVDSGGTGVRATLHLLRRPVWLAGLAAVMTSFGLQAGALAVGELSVVQPLLALELPITLLLAARVFRHPLSRREWLPIVAMSLGLALLLLSLAPSPGGAMPGTIAWVAGAGATGGLVVLLALLGLASRGNRRAGLLGVATGVAFALTAVFMSTGLSTGLPTALTRWQTYAMVAPGLGAILLLQSALQAGPLVTVQPGVTLSDPLVSVLLGVLLFDERARFGPWLVPELVAAAAIGWGTFQLSHSPVISDGDSRPASREPAAAQPDVAAACPGPVAR